MAPMQVRGVALLALALALGATSPAAADAVVTACANDKQAGAGTNFAQAMAAGGVIFFNCPPGSVIRVSGRYDLPGPTRIDGGGVTLDGGGIVRTFLTARQNIVLRRITLRGFARTRSGLGDLPGVLLAFGDAELDEVTVGASDSPLKLLHKGTISGSSFIGNTGVALNVGGEARITNSRFTGNEQALFMGGGSLRTSNFQDNTKGAVRISGLDAPAEVLHSTFTGTRGGPAVEMASQARQAGPLAVNVRANHFTDNAAGAIQIFDSVAEGRRFNLPEATMNALVRLPPARFALSYNRFNGNRGDRGAAINADLTRAAGLVSTGDIFTNNIATGEAGAVFVTGGSLTLTHAVLRGNQATGRGAAITAGPAAQVSVANSLVIGNTGTNGAVAGGTITLANVTVAENSAAGLSLDAPGSRVANTIFARNQPANCAQVAAGVFHGRNAVSDASCPGVAPSEASLDAFFVPEPGSAAARAGDPVVCRTAPVGGVDLTFQARRDAAGCALGAFERAPAAKLSSRTDRREGHADPTDDFTERDGYGPPPLVTGSPSPSPAPDQPPADTLAALRGLGVDFSVPERDVREWLANSQFTPYPSITAVLLNLLRPNGLRQPVFLDVIVWNYEHAPGARSPREIRDVNLEFLKAATVEGYNTRHGTAARAFADIVR